MKQKTNLDAVKETAIAFLNMDVEPTALAPMFVMHPVFENGFVFFPGESTPGNILDDADALRKARQMVRDKIDNTMSATGVFMIIRKSYRLTFFKYIAEYLSDVDYSQLWADAWVMSENPNQDVNVSISAAVRYFKKANKQYMMDEDELNVYNKLPEEFEVYRGVAVGRNPKGLSWTRNYNTAEWFAHRYDKENEKGYVQVATAKREDVLAYFNARNEDELVISPKSLQEIKRMEG